MRELFATHPPQCDPPWAQLDSTFPTLTHPLLKRGEGGGAGSNERRKQRGSALSMPVVTVYLSMELVDFTHTMSYEILRLHALLESGNSVSLPGEHGAE